LSFPGIKIEKLVVDSGQATVYVGLHENSKTKVAIKVMHLADPNAKAAYREELETLMQLRHPNILRVVSTFEKPQECIVTKWMEGGPLNEWLERAKKGNGGRSISWGARGRKIALDIASGLAYLHGEGKVHRDMKSLNVFMDQDGTVVLADFGFAKTIDVNKASLQMATFQMGNWMSPEMIRDESFSFASDVYAFAMIVWEILSCQIPYANFTKKRQLEDAVLAGERPPIESSWPSEARVLMTRCWQSDPAARLKAADVVKILNLPYQGPLDAKAPPVVANLELPRPLENVADLCKEGKRLLEKKQFVDACVLFRKALWGKSGDVEIMELISKCLHDSGDFVGALVMCEKILEIDPKNKSAVKQVKDLQKYLAGQKWYRLDRSAPLVSAGDVARAKKHIGEQLAMANYASALRSLHFVLIFEPTNTAVLQCVGLCLQKLLKFKEAIFAYQVLVAFTADRSDKIRLLDTIAVKLMRESRRIVVNHLVHYQLALVSVKHRWCRRWSKTCQILRDNGRSVVMELMYPFKAAHDHTAQHDYTKQVPNDGTNQNRNGTSIADGNGKKLCSSCK
jgi:serine/threonine protein kinase